MALKQRPWTLEEWNAACDDESDGIKDGFRDPRTGRLHTREHFNPDPDYAPMKTKATNPVPTTEEEFTLEVEDIDEIEPGVFHIEFWYIGTEGHPEFHDTRLSRQPCRVPKNWKGSDEEYIDDWLARRTRFYAAANGRVLKEKADKNKTGKKHDKIKEKMIAKYKSD